MTTESSHVGIRGQRKVGHHWNQGAWRTGCLSIWSLENGAALRGPPGWCVEPVHRLSGECCTAGEARGCLTWSRRSRKEPGEWKLRLPPPASAPAAGGLGNVVLPTRAQRGAEHGRKGTGTETRGRHAPHIFSYRHPNPERWEAERISSILCLKRRAPVS